MSSRSLESTLERALRAAAPALLAAFLLACGDYGGGAGGGAASAGASGASSTPSAGPTVSDPAVAAEAFATTVHPLLLQYCADCHAGAGPGSPSIAAAEVETAYQAVVNTQKVNFATPASSRLVRRLVADFHHCWSDCLSDGATMEAAIVAWAAALEAADPGGPVLAESLATGPLTLADGVEDLGAERYQDHVIAMWDFKEGGGVVAHDVSGVAPAMDLRLTGPTFLSSYGVDIEEGRAIATAETSRKLYDRIAAPSVGTQQYSVEAWVVPDNVDQEGPARIASYSRGTNRRNFTIGQVLYNYNVRNRSMDPGSDLNGTPSLQTYDADQDLQATLQHVVVTYDQFRGRRIYVNGRWTDDVDELPPGRLWNWDPDHFFILGNETSNDRQWVGKVRLVAIYDHALSDAQIRQNFDAGVGKRLILRFDVSQWIGPGGQLEFLVTELDDYSYLFCTPTLLTPNPSGFRVSNLRMAVNGVVPVSGQAFPKVSDVVTQERQLLSPTCSIVPKDRGPGQDVFTVEFETLGDFENPVAVTPPPPAVVPISAEALPVEGLRDFARINETMAEVTAVDPVASGIDEVFRSLEEQLPPSYDLRAFSSSNQVGIAKLALEYCDALVEGGPRATIFPGFDFGADAVAAFDTQAERDLVIGPMIERAVGANLGLQPTTAELTTILDTLIDDLTAGCTSATCPASRTETVVKSVCAAVLGSAAVAIH